MRFHTTILQSDRTATGIRVPPELVEELGAGKRPKVKVTIRGYTYRSSVAVMGGDYMVGVSVNLRAGAGAAGGDEVDADVELDAERREVTAPPDFGVALDAEPAARRTFDALFRGRLDAEPAARRTFGALFRGRLDAEPAARRTFDVLSYSNKLWHTLQIAGAKSDETRQRRTAKSVDVLREGRTR
jgi:hypothetical protein